MYLSIYVCRRLGLTLDLSEDGIPNAPERRQEGPAFERLTAKPDRLRDPMQLNHWLTAFLPENGAATPYRVLAAERLAPHRRDREPQTAPLILWGNTDVEYTGAIDFRQTDAKAAPVLPPRQAEPGIPITHAEIGRRLVLATNIATEGSRIRPDQVNRLTGRRSSLSGTRGKLSLIRDSEDNWRLPGPDQLGTWIVKHEHRSVAPGEAGVEAACQRALAAIGIPAAVTEARVFDGQQAVLSKRTDRWTDARGIVQGRHQEEWVQAECYPPDFKYDTGKGSGPQWPDAYRLLQDRGTETNRDTAQLTRLLAAAWLIGSGDLHRRNVGFLHTPGDRPAGIAFAPAYDMSSAIGTRFHPGFAVGFEGFIDAADITPVRWRRHAERCGIDAGITLAAVDNVIERLPDALADAARSAPEYDERVEPEVTAKRLQETLDYAAGRTRQYQDQLRTARNRRGRQMAADAAGLQAALAPTAEQAK